jgi:hypothetical protein
MDGPENLFLKLYKWAWHQGENFTSEAFAYLFGEYCRTEPAVAASLLSCLTSGNVTIPEDALRRTRVRTQSATVTGRPDIEVHAPDALVFVEVKVEEEVDLAQLKRHRQALDGDTCHGQRALALLSRYPSDKLEIAELCHAQVRFYRIAGLLERELQQMASPVARYMGEQFLGFLKERGMTMERVDASLVSGQRALFSLLGMVQEAIVASRGRISTRGAGWESIGFDFTWQQSSYWAGIYFNEPSTLVIQVDGLRAKIDSAGAVAAGFEIAWKGPHWRKRVLLQDLGFFDLSRDEQMQEAERLVRQCLEPTPNFLGNAGNEH